MSEQFCTKVLPSSIDLLCPFVWTLLKILQHDDTMKNSFGISGGYFETLQTELVPFNSIASHLGVAHPIIRMCKIIDPKITFLCAFLA